MASKVRPNPAPRRPVYLCGLAPQRPHYMNKLLEFYRKYRQYIGTDALMYVVFIVVLALMFMFFR